MISLKEVDAGYGGKVILHDISLEINEPSIYIVLGKNGAGKTTTLRVIAGILKPFKGERTVKGSIAYSSHSLALPEEMIVKEALTFFSQLLGGDVNKAIQMFKLQDLLDKKIANLSEGQKKRVSLAKIFLKDYDIYLLDEPTNALDPILASEFRNRIVELSKNKIVIYTSHNLYEARDIGKYVILIDNGKIVKFSSVSDIKVKEYLIGIRASKDLTNLLPGYYQGEYYIVKVKDPSDVNTIVEKLVKEGIQIYEVKEMKNPLEDLLSG
ncbi:ABC transporter ATP-binding protein [Acidianus manzaensis]|uniref:Heme ABC transporter n=1 Tax=Acidianus manzaensis TaxID=282676 RepID=A0A1W6K289_9CREN|nr:ABC transporter ATP-binding protein [Acidianus manzaensis]ARM76610.1 heme ABC transporter [Acidianus manzaensis]